MFRVTAIERCKTFAVNFGQIGRQGSGGAPPVVHRCHPLPGRVVIAQADLPTCGGRFNGLWLLQSLARSSPSSATTYRRSIARGVGWPAFAKTGREHRSRGSAIELRLSVDRICSCSREVSAMRKYLVALATKGREVVNAASAETARWALKARRQFTPKAVVVPAR